MMSSSETIKKIRVNLLLDQGEFGDKLGISRQAVSNYERGIRKPGIKMIKKIKELAEQNGIQVTVSDFFE